MECDGTAVSCTQLLGNLRHLSPRPPLLVMKLTVCACPIPR